jgi:hypothetical protein
MFVVPGITLVLARLAHHVFGYANPIWFGRPTDREFFVAVETSTIDPTHGLRADLIRILGIIPVSVMLTGMLSLYAGMVGMRIGLPWAVYAGLAPFAIFLTCIGVLWILRSRDHVVLAGSIIGLLLGLLLGVAGIGPPEGEAVGLVNVLLIGINGAGGLFCGILVGLMAMGGLYSGLLIDRLMFPVLVTPLLLVRFRTIICANCLRYVHPLRSTYHGGIRMCEHCRATVERTRIAGTVIFVFGTMNVPPAPRQFIRENPIFGVAPSETDQRLSFRSRWQLNQREEPIDVSQVYIDTATCDPYLLERFVTFIINFPPEQSLQSVQILYRGDLDELGSNLKNTLYNTFVHIKPSSTALSQ